MKLMTPLCPECGRPAKGTIEDIIGCAQFGGIDVDGNTEYCEDTEEYDDGSETRTDPTTGFPIVTCSEGHEWPCKIIYREGE